MFLIFPDPKEPELNIIHSYLSASTVPMGEGRESLSGFQLFSAEKTASGFE